MIKTIFFTTIEETCIITSPRELVSITIPTADNLRIITRKNNVFMDHPFTLVAGDKLSIQVEGHMELDERIEEIRPPVVDGFAKEDDARCEELHPGPYRNARCVRKVGHRGSHVANHLGTLTLIWEVDPPVVEELREGQKPSAPANFKLPEPVAIPAAKSLEQPFPPFCGKKFIDNKHNDPCVLLPGHDSQFHQNRHGNLWTDRESAATRGGYERCDAHFQNRKPQCTRLKGHGGQHKDVYGGSWGAE